MLYFGDLLNLAANLGILLISDDLGTRDRTIFKPFLIEIKVFPRRRVGLKAFSFNFVVNLLSIYHINIRWRY